MTNTPAPSIASSGRTARILAQLTTTLHEISGVPTDALDPQATFLDLGFDSLFLTQASQAFGAQFGVKITFRHLLEDLPTLSDLASYVDEKLPPEALPAEPAPPAPAQVTLQPRKALLLRRLCPRCLRPPLPHL